MSLVIRISTSHRCLKRLRPHDATWALCEGAYHIWGIALGDLSKPYLQSPKTNAHLLGPVPKGAPNPGALCMGRTPCAKAD